MASRALDWWRQAEADLAHARSAVESEHFEWACFAAQQAAAKAAKAAHQALGQDAWGHSVTELLDALQASAAGVDAALLDRARSLDKHYVTTRYPNGLPSGAPADFYTRAEDADLLLVVSKSDDEFHSRSPRYAAYFTGAGVGCDVFAYTEAELAASTASGDAFLERILAESIPLAERTASERR